MKLRILVAISILALAACSKQAEKPLADAADTIYINAKIYTIDKKNSVASAVAVRNGKIQAVGSDAEVKALANDQTVVHDLQGRMLMHEIHDNNIPK